MGGQRVTFGTQVSLDGKGFRAGGVRRQPVVQVITFSAYSTVMRWIGDGSVRDEQQIKAGMEAWERQQHRRGFRLFVLELRGTGELIGFTG